MQKPDFPKEVAPAWLVYGHRGSISGDLSERFNGKTLINRRSPITDLATLVAGPPDGWLITSSTIRLGPTPIKARLNSRAPKPGLIVLSHATRRGRLETAGELFACVLRSPRNSPLVITRTHPAERIIYASHLEHPDSVRHCAACPVYTPLSLCV